MRGQLATPRRATMILGLLPGVLLYSFVLVFPLLFSIRYSFTDWTGGSRVGHVGLLNYAAFFHDAHFWRSFRNTIVITVINVVGQVGFGVVIAAILSTTYARFAGAHRVAIFLPVVISPIVIGLVWTMIYNSRTGLLNLFLQSVGLQSLIRLWLDDPRIVLYSVSVPVVWQYIGLYMVIVLGAFSNIPPSVIESSMLDGAGGLRRMVQIQIPMIYPTFKVAMMLCVSGTLKIFDHIYVMTGGGPGESSMTMTQYSYNVSFNLLKLGYGSTLSIGLIVIILAITGITMRFLGGRRYE